MFFYILYKFGYFLANAFPLRGAYWLAERFSDAQYLLAKKDRDAVAGNISIVLKKDIKECYSLAHKAFRSFGLYLVDFFRIPRLTKEDIEKRVSKQGFEHIDNALKKGKGAIVLTCHIGSWEMGGVVMAMLGYDISGVVLNHRHTHINDFFVRQRECKGMKVITVSSVMKRCFSALQKNGMLALVGDRDFTNNGIMLDFFGVPTSIPKGPAMLSLKTGAPIVPVFFLRDKKFNYRFIYDKPIDTKYPEGADKDLVIKDITKKVVSVMEKYVKEYPEQWLVFRKFWEEPVDAFVI